MTEKIYFRNKQTGKKYEVIKLDREKGEVTLKGQYKSFVERYDKERFQRLGYELVREDA
jgi:hypothetical protein